ncbi:MAG: hypothetical protein ACPLRN_00905 [Microgenomates group bacterium]
MQDGTPTEANHQMPSTQKPQLELPSHKEAESAPINNQVLQLFLFATVDKNIYRAGFQILRARLQKALSEGKIRDPEKAQEILDNLNKSFQKLTGQKKDDAKPEEQQDEFKEKLEKMKDNESPEMQALAYDIEIHILQEQEQTIQEQLKETSDEGYKNELNQQLKSITDQIKDLKKTRTSIKDGQQQEIPDQVQAVLIPQIKKMAQVVKQTAINEDLGQTTRQETQSGKPSAQENILTPEEIQEIENNPISSFISTLYQILDESLTKSGDQVFDKNSFDQKKFDQILRTLTDEKVIDEDGSSIIKNHLISSFNALQELSKEEKEMLTKIGFENIVKKLSHWLFIGGGLVFLYMYLANKRNQNQG